MKLGIFGRGRLAAAVRTAALEAGHEVCWSLGRADALPDGGVDVAVDCSLPEAVESHVLWAAATGTPLAVGVTAINPAALAPQAEGKTALLFAPNFSLSVALVARLAAVLARYAAITPGFDPFVMEKHHARKADAPSGTAKLLANRMLVQMSAKEALVIPGAAPLKPEDLCIASVRAGSGGHSWHIAGIDSPDESIELKHEARNLMPFGRGAVAACAFLAGKRGIFSMDDVARESLQGVLGALE